MRSSSILNKPGHCYNVKKSLPLPAVFFLSRKDLRFLEVSRRWLQATLQVEKGKKMLVGYMHVVSRVSSAQTWHTLSLRLPFLLSQYQTGTIRAKHGAQASQDGILHLFSLPM